MKKIALFCFGFLGSTLVFAAPQPVSAPCGGNPQQSPYYGAVQWYRDSAERNALYREIFMLGEAQIKAMVKDQKLRPHQWGIVVDVDETALDNSIYYKDYMNCSTEVVNSEDNFSVFVQKEVSIATPGVKTLTCAVKKMGGYVSMVTNQNGNYVDPTTHRTETDATAANLKKEGICFDQVVLAPDNTAPHKGERFAAVESGVYDKSKMAYTNTLPAHRVIAYFGDNIQDFPAIIQTDMVKQDPNGPAYDAFGKKYFLLPNPMYGSFQGNAFQ